MKKAFTLILAVVALFITSSAFGQPGQVVGAAMLSPDRTEFDFGTIHKASDGNCSFIITNTGDQPLIISQCKGSCGCTTPKCDPNPVAPGETTEIKVHYDTMRMGPFTKTVTVNWNSADGSVTTLTIKGEVIE